MKNRQVFMVKMVIRGVQNINMSKFGLADYLNPFSWISSSQKYQNFLCRIMGSASSGIGYFGKNPIILKYLGYFQFYDLSFMFSYQIILKSLLSSGCQSENTKSPHESKSI